jgi:dihydrofolate reductase
MKISIYIAISANGFISNSRNVPDWLSNEYGEGLYAMCNEYNAVIMGKTTYNILAPNYLPLKDRGTTVVLTSDKNSKSENPTVVFTRDNPLAIVKNLEAKGHTKAVIIGGAMAIKEFVNAGLVDDIYFVFEPVLFHAGLPLLKDVNLDFKLRLLEMKKLNDNTVRLHYEVKK